MKLNAFLLLIILAAGTALHAQQAKRGPRQVVDLNKVPDSNYYPGQVYFKFRPGFDPYLKKEIAKNNKGEIASGIDPLDRILVRLQAHALKQSFEPVLSKVGFKQKHASFDLQRWYTLELPKNIPVKQAIQQLLALSDIIEIAEPSYVRHLFEENDPVLTWTPSDSAFNQQWHYNHTAQQGPTSTPGTDADIDLPEAWALESGKPNVIVAVLDGGVDTSHPDLRPNLWIGSNGERFGYNWNTGSPMIQPNTHGTHVNGTIGAVNNNTIGVSGVAGGNGNSNSGVRLMSMQIFNNSGQYAGDAAVANAFVFAADRGAAIAQNSWGGGSFSNILTDAIDYFIMNGGGNVLSGGIVFFSAGNDGNETQNFPGTYPPVICVAATNYDDKKSWYSVYGDWVDIAAPGGETTPYSGGPFQFGGKKGILSTVPVINGGLYAWMQGTSMACPHVSGVAALCVSKAPGIMSSEQLRQIILQQVDDIYPLNTAYAGKLGTGRLNAFKAVKAASMQSASLVDSASNFKASQNCGQVVLSWNKNASNNNVMIAVSDSLLFGLPTGTYNVNDAITGGGKVIYSGNASNFNLNIPVNQPKYFRIWSYVGSNYSLSKTTSTIYKISSGVLTLTDGPGCEINISWNDALGCITDSIMLLAHVTNNYGPPAGNLAVGDTITGGAKVIYKGRSNSFVYNTDLDSTIYIQKWNFNASLVYSNENPSNYAIIKKANSIASINAIAAGSHDIDIHWQTNTAATCFTSDTYMLVYSNSTFGNPSGIYNIGDQITGGGQVIYKGTATQFHHSGLMENTNYCYKVYKVRNGFEYSSGKSACTYTACAIATIPIPYAYGFNGTNLSNPDECFWEIQNNSSIANALKIVTEGIHPDLDPLEGTGMLQFNAYNIPTDESAILKTKVIKKGAGNSLDIRFRWYQDSSNYTTSEYLGEGVTVQWSNNAQQWKNLEFYPRVPVAEPPGWSFKQLTLPAEAVSKDTIYLAFRFVSKFGNNMFLDDLHLQWSSFKSSNGISMSAVSEFTDSASTWTHYYDSTGARLLSIKKYGQTIGKAGHPGFQVKVAGNSSASLIPAGNNYVTNTGGWISMNRYFDIHPISEITDTAKIRFYYTANDLVGLNNAAPNLVPARTNISSTDLFAYKINDASHLYYPDPVAGHQNIPFAASYAANGFVQYFNSSKADTAGWQYSNAGNDVFAMEYTVQRLSDGGSLGIGSTNGYGARQLLTYTFTGNGNWNIASNWLNNAIPPGNLPASAQIVINPSGNGECVLNVEQHIMPGASLIVMPGKKFRVASHVQVK